MNSRIEQQLIAKAEEDKIARFVVGAIIMNNSKEILLLSRNSNDFMGGIDELPSGKVEKDDYSLLEALKREVLEETNLKIIEVVDYVGHFDYISSSGKKTRQFNFLVKAEGDVKVDPQEHSGFVWSDKNSLKDTNLTGNVLVILNNVIFN